MTAIGAGAFGTPGPNGGFDWADTGADPSTTETRAAPERVLLGELIRSGISPPSRLADGYLYGGHVHSLSGPPESGKTTLAAYWAACEIRLGHNVFWWDEEAGEEQVAERMMSFGLTPEQVDAHLFYFPFPGFTWSADQLALYLGQLAEHRPSLVVMDSSSAILSVADMNEDRTAEANQFYKGVLLSSAR